MPHDHFKPSIWCTALIRLLIRRPNALFYLKSVQQWRLGATGVKPTTLLCANISLDGPFSECEVPGAIKPTTPLIGKTVDGSFRISAAKEYPPALNRAFAMAIAARCSRLPKSDDLVRATQRAFGSELVRQCACPEGGEILPDFQPDRA